MMNNLLRKKFVSEEIEFSKLKGNSKVLLEQIKHLFFSNIKYFFLVENTNKHTINKLNFISNHFFSSKISLILFNFRTKTLINLNKL